MGGADHRDRRARRPTSSLEAAHFDAVAVARTARRHKLSSEASKRFERGVDPELAPSRRPAPSSCSSELGGAVATPASLEVRHARGARPRSRWTRRDPAVGRAATIPAGRRSPAAWSRSAATVDRAGRRWSVTPPSWRPDLTDPNDLAEEVIRLDGYDRCPRVLPRRPGRAAASPTRQRLRRRVGQALAARGLRRGAVLPVRRGGGSGRARPAGRRRPAQRAAAGQPALRRGAAAAHDAAARACCRAAPQRRPRHHATWRSSRSAWSSGPARRAAGAAPAAPSTAGRPTRRSRALDAALPAQPRHVAAVLRRRASSSAGWWGPGRPAGWADAVEAARTVARAGGGRADRRAPTSTPRGTPAAAPRCTSTARLVGHAGELHPRVVAALGLPDAHLRDGARPGRCSGADHAPVPAPADLHLPGRHPGRRARRRRRRPGGRGRGGAARRRGRAAGVAAAVRRLPRAAGRRGPDVAGLRPAVPGPGPHAHRRGGRRAAREAAVAEAARRTGAVQRA